MQTVVDYIIVGQGLAGSFLSLELEKRGRSYIVIDKGIRNSSSWVAAGLINPLVLKRLTLSWRAEEFINYNKAYYENLNAFFGSSLHREVPLLKLISSSDEIKYWQNKFTDESLQKWLYPEINPYEGKLKTTVDFNFGKVKHSSWLNVKEFLKSWRKKLEENKCLIVDEFQSAHVKSEENKVIYKSIIAKKLVFCDGANVVNNPYFSFVKMGLNKGELLEIETKNQLSESILKKKVFILPIEEKKYKIGATYQWRWEDEKASEEKKEVLIEGFKELFPEDFKIINHEAGVRPSVIDRRPIMGTSELSKNIFLFNGLGSRACLMGPLLSEEMINYIENGVPLHPEVRLNRFKQD